jgi:hypothetical protein
MLAPELFLKITNDNGEKINSSIIKANGFILEKYSSDFIYVSSEDKNELLKSLWDIEFKGQVVDEWNGIQFNSLNDKMIFLLRWA